MAFSSTITLDDASGDDVVYVLVRTNNDGTSRIDQASTLALPQTMNIKHSSTGKQADAVDRHLVQFIKNIEATPANVPLVINVTLQVPRNIAVTNQHVLDVLANARNFLAVDANVTALLRGES